MTRQIPVARHAALAALMAPAILAGCASGGSEMRTTRVVDYVCTNGERVTVVFQPNTARITSSDPVLELPRRPAPGSGFAFGTDQNQIQGQGPQMTWTRGFAAPLQCREVSRR